MFLLRKGWNWDCGHLGGLHFCAMAVSYSAVGVAIGWLCSVQNLGGQTGAELVVRAKVRKIEVTPPTYGFLTLTPEATFASLGDCYAISTRINYF